MEKHLSIFIALFAIVFLCVDKRNHALILAMAGIGLLFWDEKYYVPSRYRNKKCGNNIGPKKNQTEQQLTYNEVPADHEQWEYDAWDEYEDPEPLTEGFGQPENDTEEHGYDDYRAHDSHMADDLSGIVYDEYFSGPTYARTRAKCDTQQSILQSRIGAPTENSGRDRLKRITPIVTFSAYRDRTGQMCRFNHLR